MGVLDALGAAASGAGKATQPPKSFGGAVSQGAQIGAGQAAASAGAAGASAAGQVFQAPPAGPPSHTDASSGGYDFARANAFKQTQAYQQAVQAVFAAQSQAQKLAIVRGLQNYPAKADPWTFNAVKGAAVGDFTGAALKGVTSALPPQLRSTTTIGSPFNIDPSRGQNFSKALRTVAPGVPVQPGAGTVDLDKVASALAGLPGDAAKVLSNNPYVGLGDNKGGKDQMDQGTGTGGSIDSATFTGPGRAGRNIAAAFVQDPGGVTGGTLKGLGEALLGMATLPFDFAKKSIEEGGPQNALADYISSAAHDYSARYGQSDQQQIARFKQAGAAAEAFDLLTVLGGGDVATVPFVAARRAAYAKAAEAAAAAGEDAPKAGFLTRPRPDLVQSGGLTRPQELGSGALRTAGQRLEDQLRAKAHPLDTAANAAGEQAARGALHPTSVNHPVKQVAPIFQNRAIRMVHSGIAHVYRVQMQRQLDREVRQGAVRSAAALSKTQREAAFYAVHGFRVDTVRNFRADLKQRLDHILSDRTKPESLAYNHQIPEQFRAKVDEVGLIEKLYAKADKIAGPKMVRFQREEADRATRLEEATALNPATAAARRLRPTADRIGIEHPDASIAREKDALAQTIDRELANLDRRRALVEQRVVRGSTEGERAVALEKRDRLEEHKQEIRAGRQDRENAIENSRTQRLGEYVDQVRQEMNQRGLPEPGYWQHREIPITEFRNWVSGRGGRAMPGNKRSTWALYRAGIADHTLQAYFDGLARSVKRPYQWRLVADQLRAARYPKPTRAEIEATLGHYVHPDELSGHDLKRVLTEQRGYDLRKVSFVRMPRLEERLHDDRHSIKDSRIERGHIFRQVDEQHLADDLHKHLNQDDTVFHHGTKGDAPEAFGKHGWVAMPREAFDQIHGGLQSEKLAGRLVGKVTGGTAGLILGSNPHFLIMNTLAHLIPALAATKGGILPDMLRMPFWWHGLTDAEKDTVDAYARGQLGHYNKTARVASTAPSPLHAASEALQTSKLARAWSVVNPFHAILKGEDLQSNFFRRTVMYHELKRQAFSDMAHEYGHAAWLYKGLAPVFKMGPAERMTAMLHEMPQMEALARTMVNILGDYGRFTNFERRWLNNKAVMFYSFIRHVTRTLLYVLPVRHPLMTGLLGELGGLHADEVRKIIGPNAAPWDYGRVFFDNNGKLSSIDATSTSPISSPLVNMFAKAEEGPKAVFKGAFELTNPVLQSLMNTFVYGQTPDKKPLNQNLWTTIHDLYSLSYPLRTASYFKLGLAPQQSDTVPWIHENPEAAKKTKPAQAYQLAKEQARGPLDQFLLGSALGLYPKPDDSRVVAQEQALQAAKKGRGRGRPSGATGSWSVVRPGGGSSGSGRWSVTKNAPSGTEPSTAGTGSWSVAGSSP